MLYIPVLSTHPYFNLALEEYVFDRIAPGEELFFLWRNDSSVIIGKNQNAFEQINLKVVEEAGIPVIRRISGGGAVYHDLGNVNFTFVLNRTSDRNTDYGRFAAVIVSALGRLGVGAVLNNRSDILVDGKKVSGNARHYGRDRILYHGTLLYDTDLERLAEVLYVNPEGMESRGIKSVYSTVANIGRYMERSVSAEAFQGKMAENVIDLLGIPVNEYNLTEIEKKGIERLATEKYGTWDWNYGYSPAFSIRKKIKWNDSEAEIKVSVRNGIIENVELHTMAVCRNNAEDILQVLKGCRFKKDEVVKLLEGINISMDFSDLLDFLHLSGKD